MIILARSGLVGLIRWLLGFDAKPRRDRVLPSGRAIVYVLLVPAATTFVLRVRDLLGAETFKNLILLRAVDASLATDYVTASVSETDMRTEDVFAWLQPVAVARLAEDVPSEHADLLFLSGVGNSGPS